MPENADSEIFDLVSQKTAYKAKFFIISSF